MDKACLGKIAYINLNTGCISFTDIKPEIIKAYIGGRGINVFLLYSYLARRNFDQTENPLIIGSGLLTGLPAPCMARLNITGVSPETGFLGDSNMGGFFGPALKKCGFSHLYIHGVSDRPVYIHIQNGAISLLDAGDVWGRRTQDAQRILEEKHGSNCISLVIGPAGENLVPYSAVISSQKNAAARTGMGCLMGMKRLKAITVTPGGSLPLYRRREFLDFSGALYKRLKDSKFAKMLHDYGTPYLFKLHNRQGIVRSYGTAKSRFDHAEGLDVRVLRNQFYKKATGCFACSIKCHHIYSFYDEGLEITGEGPEYGTLSAFGPICGIDDLKSILKINSLVNDLGLDSITTGNLVAFLMGNAKSLKDPYSDYRIKWGDSESAIKLIEDIAFRRGTGTVLSDGVKGLSRYFPPEALKGLPLIKGLIQSDGVDLRAGMGFALGAATASRGADHLRSRPTLEIMNIDIEKLKKIYKSEHISNDPKSYEGKARMVHAEEKEYALGDSAGICRFAQRFNSTDAIEISDISRLIYLSTGLKLSNSDLDLAAERINTTERLILNGFGIDSGDDKLPEFYYRPVANGPNQGEFIDISMFRQILSEYYELHRWTRDGKVPESLAEKLGIFSLLEKLD